MLFRIKKIISLLILSTVLSFSGASYTIASINSFLVVGDSGSQVIELQSFLKDHGFFNGEINGQYGSLTSKAVSAFQKANGIEETGNVGSITKEKINSILSDSVKLPQSVVTKSFTNTNNVCGYI